MRSSMAEQPASTSEYVVSKSRVYHGSDTSRESPTYDISLTILSDGPNARRMSRTFSSSITTTTSAASKSARVMSVAARRAYGGVGAWAVERQAF